jgi:hypothetical protein
MDCHALLSFGFGAGRGVLRGDVAEESFFASFRKHVIAGIGAVVLLSDEDAVNIARTVSVCVRRSACVARLNWVKLCQ